MATVHRRKFYAQLVRVLPQSRLRAGGAPQRLEAVATRTLIACRCSRVSSVQWVPKSH